MKRTLTAQSPAKLILSGEHAVLYGKPALAMAINKYVKSTASFKISPRIFFHFKSLRYTGTLTFETLKELKKRVQCDYERFLNGQCSIREVLEKPFELLQFTVSHVLEKLNLSCSHGLDIQTHSDVPIGYGLGSSAATIISTLKVISNFFKMDLEPAKLLNLGVEAENLQHGRSSGLDLHLAFHGGCIRFQEGLTQKRDLFQMPMYLVYTGTPMTSTGECVSHASRYFKDESLANAFEKVTVGLDSAFEHKDQHNILSAVRENHRLLTHIGVVPQKIQAFVQAIEKKGASAKICGSGSIKGENAGVVLVVADDFDCELENLIDHFGYTWETVKPDFYGTTLL